MTYQLGQTPVPVWAEPNRRPIQLDLETLPNYFLTEEAFKNPAGPGAGYAGGSHGGWWNAVAKSSQRKEQIDVDPALLTAYDLNSKWENRMDDEPLQTSGIIDIDKMRAKFIKSLGSSPFYPILLRGSASMFSVISLGLSAAVFVQTGHGNDEEGRLITGYSPTASTIFTVVMTTISFVYLLYSLWDETFGQPLGLRHASSKVKFVALDLALLCLNAASLALAFEVMISREYICPATQNPQICKLHKAVVAFVLVQLVTWFLTFLVSTFRMIDCASH